MKKLPAPPLWLYGLFEALQAVLATALFVAVPVLGISIARTFGHTDVESTAELAGQIWLVLHGVPLHLPPELTGGDIAGWFHLVPLGFTLIPFLLAWRAGRRLAQGAYPQQLWHGLAVFSAGYAAAAVGISIFADQLPSTAVWAAMAAVLITGVGSLAGCYAEARSATRMIGRDLEARIEAVSQQLKWAGSYAWSVLRGGTVAAIAAVGFSALLLVGWIGAQWMDLVNAYQEFDAGIWGAAGLTLLQLGVLPNMVMWTLAYSTGGGFMAGTDAPVTPFRSEVGEVPDVPLLTIIPAEAHTYAPAVLAVPLLAGAVAGWWLMREGENHFDDWCQLKLKLRPVSLAASTLVQGLLTGVVAALLLILPLWLSHISLGVGRMTDLGPHAAVTAVLLGAWTALGCVAGYLLAPATALSRRRRAARAQVEEDPDAEEAFSAEVSSGADAVAEDHSEAGRRLT